MDPWAGQDGHGKSGLTGIRSPDSLARNDFKPTTPSRPNPPSPHRLWRDLVLGIIVEVSGSHDRKMYCA